MIGSTIAGANSELVRRARILEDTGNSQPYMPFGITLIGQPGQMNSYGRSVPNTMQSLGLNVGLQVIA